MHLTNNFQDVTYPSSQFNVMSLEVFHANEIRFSVQMFKWTSITIKIAHDFLFDTFSQIQM